MVQPDADIERQALEIAQSLADAAPSARERRLRELETAQPVVAGTVRELLAHMHPADLVAEAVWRDAASVQPGERIGAWQIVDLLGRGGMGEVYRAQRADGAYDQQVALKLLWNGIAPLTGHFHRERQLLARLQHQGIAQLIDGGTTDGGRPWFAMELVEGQAITAWCDARRLDLAARVRLFTQLCDAVRFAHRNLVVHRDIKPGNVLVDADGRLKLLDFGVARLLEEGDAQATQTIAFTPAWAAPEQKAGAAGSTSIDVYQMGLLLRQLLCGLAPAPEMRLETRMSQALRETQPQAAADVAALACARALPTLHALRMRLRGDLDAIVLRATAEDPGDRYESAADLEDDLRRWMAGHSLRGARQPWPVRFGKFIRRNLPAATIVLMLLTGLVLATVLALRSAHSERLQREAAQAEVARMQAIREYLQLMFRNIGEAPAGSDIDMHEVLMRAATQLAHDFRDDPLGGKSAAMLLAELYLNLGDYRAAAPLLEQVLAWPGIEQRQDIKAEAHARLAVVRQMAGDLKDGFAQLDRAYAIWSASPQRYAANMNEDLVTRARLQRASGDLEASISTLRRMIDERRNTLKLEDRGLANALSELCNSLVQAGSWQQSEPACLSAMAMYERLNLGSTASALGVRNALAASYVRNGRHAEAERLFRQLIADRARLLGEESPDYAILLLNLGSTLAVQQRWQEALPLQQKAHALLQRLTGPDTPPTLSAAMKLGETQVELGELQDAEAAARRIGEALRKTPALRPALGGPFALMQARIAIKRGEHAAARAHLDAAMHLLPPGQAQVVDRLRAELGRP